MKQKFLNTKNLLFFSCLMFCVIAIEFWISLNINPKLLTENHPLRAVRTYYSLAFEHHLLSKKIPLNFHISLGIIVLILGYLQLNKKFHFLYPKIHKLFGYTYVVLGMVVTAFGLFLTQNNVGGLLTSFAFFIIAFCWYFSAYKLVRHAATERYHLHRAWAIRNYFSLLATAFARPLYVVLDFIFSSYPAEILFPLSNWTAIVISFISAQWFIETSQFKDNQEDTSKINFKATG